MAALLEIRSRRIEIYSARLRLHAKFSGIRCVTAEPRGGHEGALEGRYGAAIGPL